MEDSDLDQLLVSLYEHVVDYKVLIKVSMHLINLEDAIRLFVSLVKHLQEVCKNQYLIQGEDCLLFINSPEDLMGEVKYWLFVSLLAHSIIQSIMHSIMQSIVHFIMHSIRLIIIYCVVQAIAIKFVKVVKKDFH